MIPGLKHEEAFALAQRLRFGLPLLAWSSVEPALAFASRVHREELRPAPGDDRAPFILHPLRVALSLLEEARVSDPLPLATALTHDTLEHDRRLTAAELVSVVGAEAAGAVLTLSVPKKLNSGVPPAVSRVLYLDQLRSAPPWVLIVKAADRLDNHRYRAQMGPEGKREELAAQEVRDYVPLWSQRLPVQGRPLAEKIRRLVTTMPQS